jgi:hypothetical protein
MYKDRSHQCISLLEDDICNGIEFKQVLPLSRNRVIDSFVAIRYNAV